MSDSNNNNSPGFFLSNLQDVLSPRGIDKIIKFPEQSENYLQGEIRSLIVDRTANFKEISDKITNFYNAKTETAETNIDDFGKTFHALSMRNGPVSVGSYQDSKYWVQGSNIDANSAKDAIWKSIFGDYIAATGTSGATAKGAKCDVIVIIARDPYMSPADARTEDIELFLNYMPSLVVNQMVPYLEIEMSMNRTANIDSVQSGIDFVRDATSNLNTPSILRFLLGSTNSTTQGFLDGDRSLIRYSNPDVKIVKVKKKEPQPAAPSAASPNNTAVKKDKEKQAQDAAKAEEAPRAPTARSRASVDILSGMELFLSPATLTNMDTLKSSNKRLMDVKPFLPFASIVSFEVSVSNAGAGAMSTKKAKLQLKIHDKARIAEISEFIKGSAGFNDAKIWTSYGWLAPRKDPYNIEDQFANLINEKMFMEDCWQVVNTQFTIEAVGSVVLNIDLIVYGSRNIKKHSIALQNKTFQAYSFAFEGFLQEIEELARPLRDSPLGPDARITQILNAGVAGSMLPADIKDPAGTIDKVVRQYISSGKIEPKAGEKLIERLKLVLDPYAGKSTVAEKRAESVSDLIKDAAKGHDPFIPIIPPPPAPPPPPRAARPAPGVPAAKPAPVVEEKKPANPSEDYFNQRLINEINLFFNPPPPPKDEKGKKNAPPPASQEAPATPPKPDIPVPVKVISFGKLFCKLAIPAILNSYPEVRDSDKTEVQVIFYTLNDECGPVSGQSIAEFPIDLQRLAYSIDDLLSAKNKYDFTIEEFLKIIINNQFMDDRSIGYGMLSKQLFKPFDKDKPFAESAEKNDAYETAMAAWQAENGGFRKPMIEMFLETAKPTAQAGATTRRIHRVLDATGTGKPKLDENTIIRIHIYDKQNNPRKIFSQIIETSEGFNVASLNDISLNAALNSAAKSKDKATIDKIRQYIDQSKKELENSAGGASIAKSQEIASKLEKELGLKPGTILKTPTGEPITRIERTLGGPNGIRAQLRKLAPTLEIGTNGTMIKNVSLQSKTDDLMAAANLVNIMKPKSGNNAGSSQAPASGLEGPGGLPIRTVPAQLTMTTMGCPALRLYQQFFVDMGTGTSLDNLYQVTQINHKMSPGKFESSLTFMYTNGYGKFAAPTSMQLFLKKAGETASKLQAQLKEDPKNSAKDDAKKPSDAKEKGKSAQDRTASAAKFPDPVNEGLEQSTPNISGQIPPPKVV